MYPLNLLLRGYERPKKIVGTPEAETAFENIKEDINNCPFLFFVDDTVPIYPHTDASDYRIGALLFQIVEGAIRPIAFISKALNEQ